MRVQSIGTNNVDLDKMALYEPSHLDLHGLQLQLFSFSVLKLIKQNIVELQRLEL